MESTGTVTIEFFGIPRLRAGMESLTIPVGTIAEVLAGIEQACPGLAGLRHEDGRLAAHYLLSINGERFVRDANQHLQSQDRLLLLSVDAGG